MKHFPLAMIALMMSLVAPSNFHIAGIYVLLIVSLCFEFYWRQEAFIQNEFSYVMLSCILIVILAVTISLVWGPPKAHLAVFAAAIPMFLPGTVDRTIANTLRQLKLRGLRVIDLPVLYKMSALNVLVVNRSFLTSRKLSVHGKVPLGAFTAEQLMRWALLCSRDDTDIDTCLKQFQVTSSSVLENGSYSSKDFKPFMSRGKKFASVLVTDTVTKEEFLVYKGAPQTILDLCNLSNDDDGEERKALETTIREHSQQGLRLLGVSRQKKDSPKMELMGFISFTDPVHPQAKDYVQLLRSIGIRVIILTGDHASLGEELAAYLGMDSVTFRSTPELYGDFNSGISLRKILDECDGWGDTTPADESRIIRQLRECNSRNVVGSLVKPLVEKNESDVIYGVDVIITNKNDILGRALASVVLARDMLHRLKLLSAVFMTNTTYLTVTLLVLQLSYGFDFPLPLLLIVLLLHAGQLYTLTSDDCSTTRILPPISHFFLQSVVKGVLLSCCESLLTLSFFHLVFVTKYFQTTFKVASSKANVPLVNSLLMLHVILMQQLSILILRSQSFFFMSLPLPKTIVAMVLSQLTVLALVTNASVIELVKLPLAPLTGDWILITVLWSMLLVSVDYAKILLTWLANKAEYMSIIGLLEQRFLLSKIDQVLIRAED